MSNSLSMGFLIRVPEGSASHNFSTIALKPHWIRCTAQEFLSYSWVKVLTISTVERKSDVDIQKWIKML